MYTDEIFKLSKFFDHSLSDDEIYDYDNDADLEEIDSAELNIGLGRSRYLKYGRQCGFVNSGREVIIENPYTDTRLQVTVGVTALHTTPPHSYTQTRVLRPALTDKTPTRVFVGCTKTPEPGGKFLFSVVSAVKLDESGRFEYGAPISLRSNYAYVIAYPYPGPLSCLSGQQSGCSQVVDAGSQLGRGSFCDYAVICSGATSVIMFNHFRPAV